MSVTFDQYRSYANFAFSQGRRAQLVTDSGLTLNGNPSLAPADNPPLRSFTCPPTEGAWWYFPTRLDLCQPLNESTKMTNWFEIILDPSILSQVPTPSAFDPSSFNAKFSKNATGNCPLSCTRSAPLDSPYYRLNFRSLRSQLHPTLRPTIGAIGPSVSRL
jgi:hypothetical protein